jgi:hypothetical protein
VNAVLGTFTPHLNTYKSTDIQPISMNMAKLDSPSSRLSFCTRKVILSVLMIMQLYTKDKCWFFENVLATLFMATSDQVIESCNIGLSISNIVKN